jgi:hypothetical protein
MMKIILKQFTLLLLVVSGFNSVAAEPSPLTTIKRFISYNQYGDGDVVFTVANPTSSCFGYWINKNDAGFNANLSLILAAYQAKTNVKVHGLTDQKWSGSGNFWCKLYAIEYSE